MRARMCAALAERGFDIVSGGTDNHLFLLSLVGREITGKDADAALGRAHITVNKNAVPNDPRPPMITSGLRLGTPASTTRGFREPEIRQVAGWIADILDAGGADSAIERVRPQVVELCRRFPVYRRLNPDPGQSMHCPFCGHVETKVTDSRLAADGGQIRRRRECLSCGERFTTFETAELLMPRVIKSDGSREPFDERKLSARHDQGAGEAPGQRRGDRAGREPHLSQAARARRARGAGAHASANS